MDSWHWKEALTSALPNQSIPEIYKTIHLFTYLFIHSFILQAGNELNFEENVNYIFFSWDFTV